MSPRRLVTWAVRGAAVALGVCGLVAVGLGVVLLPEDSSPSDGAVEALGLLQGSAVGGLGLVLLGVCGLVLALSLRHTRAAAIVLCAFGAVVASAGALVTPRAGVSLATLLVVGGLFVGGLGFGAALAAPEVAIGSPGDDSQ